MERDDRWREREGRERRERGVIKNVQKFEFNASTLI